jgi:hypothetical protein
MTEKLTPVCEGYACCQQTVICGCVCYLKTFMKWAGILLRFMVLQRWQLDPRLQR